MMGAVRDIMGAAVLLAATASGAGATSPPPRDPAIAVREEFDMAVGSGTREALELFIARHPDSPLADKARALLGKP